MSMWLIPAVALGFGSSKPTTPTCTSEEPPPKYTGKIDYAISAYGKSCLETEANCYNRYSPYIPMNLEVESGSIVEFKTRDLWDQPGWDKTEAPDADANFDLAYGDLAVVHIITGPVAVKGAKAGDKLAIEILDITPLEKGFTMADTPLGFMDNVQSEDQPFGNAPESYRAWCWWDYMPEKGGWVSATFEDVVIPYEPFPGSIGVLPSLETVKMKLDHHGNESTLYGGPQWAVNTEMAVPSSVCGAGGSAPETCLRTLAGGDYFGNTDTQRMGVGTTLFLECEVDGCGVGTGDVHGAQGDGEVSITAIEMEASVVMKLTLIKKGDPGFAKPVPSMYGTTSIKRMSPGEFISFMGFPFKETGAVPSQYKYAPSVAKALVSSKIIPESMSLAGANALLKACTFLMDNAGYSFGEAMIIASVSVDLRVAQLVDKPAVGMEAIIDLSIFKGALYDKMKAAATM
mmetsp:Transcript_63388/g.105448  ORF Transcript_63388/g.105448 Transcript_63388/m.105448 type:complete len:459 (+) Transcript_63388:78-1454(+)|eukprot:CAMPEP_0119299844 /NCGR_PEP_ID=MMETSP1333-20130426/1864_1 /TAXON_ID=418940 /ORGANISM="Scyphosphaera apsteinii, Strain RCC1455" /LENGTH=458 /DNA_ID=CAMNT_0007301415 /DNA_START=78 /DNA_END=1454 /DNA_ORIENTATION=+